MPTNILLIMADQLRADALACNGNPVIDTPNLDRLARSGVNCTARTSCPARASAAYAPVAADTIRSRPICAGDMTQAFGISSIPETIRSA